MTIGDAILKIRKSFGQTQRQIATVLVVTNQCIPLLEKGRNTCHVNLLRGIYTHYSYDPYIVSALTDERLDIAKHKVMVCIK